MAFSGTVESDYLKFIPKELENKERFIDFAASDFATLRRNLIQYTKANFPLDYNNFDESDFGIVLIELMAAIGHIQSHKADYLANENFLRTARERSSVKKLMELIGIRMKGPISAAANASLSFEFTDAVSSLTLSPSQRTISIKSPQDGAPLSYTIYKVNTDGSIDLQSNTDSIEFVFDSTRTPVITSAILLEGALVVESGVFTAPNTVKTIRLSQSPYVEKSSQVFIEGSEVTNGVYLEEDNLFFASGATDKVYQVATNNDFVAEVIFGDSTISQSPSQGDSYTVTYRVGGGSRGNISESFINAQLNGTARKASDADQSEQPIQVTVENSSQATGGSDAETTAKVKKYGPLKFRSQDRLVTLSDYTAFANTFASNYGSTGKATASVRRAYSSANTIDVFVLEKANDSQLRQATQEYKKQLLEAMTDKKMLTDEPVIVDGLIRTLDLNVTVKLDDRFKREKNSIVSRVNNTILTYFNVDNTDFGQGFSPEDLVRVILKDPSIRFATVNNLDRAIEVAFNEIIQLNNVSISSEII
tara:strand:- start:2712 stop:4313 length:1602 start_codon:yes stop_codon:yes gene_type:complete